jgi:hypothetical protein
MFSPFKDLIMKKLTFCMLATFFLLSVTPTQLKASSESIAATPSSVKSTEPTANTDRLNEIKSIGLTTLNSSENKEILKENNLLKNDQIFRGQRYRDRHPRRDVDVTVVSDSRVRGDGYYQGRHSHGAAYIGGGGVLILILILILVL